MTYNNVRNIGAADGDKDADRASQCPDDAPIAHMCRVYITCHQPEDVRQGTRKDIRNGEAHPSDQKPHEDVVDCLFRPLREELFVVEGIFLLDDVFVANYNHRDGEYDTDKAEDNEEADELVGILPNVFSICGRGCGVVWFVVSWLGHATLPFVQQWGGPKDPDSFSRGFHCHWWCQKVLDAE